MFLFSPFAHPAGSFQEPQDVPLADPDETPVTTVQINCDWLPFVRGALTQLYLQSCWNVADQSELGDIQQRVSSLIDLFQDCGSPGVPFACPYDYRVSQQGFALLSEPTLSPGGHRGVYVPGSGWASTVETDTSSGNQIASLRIFKTYSSAMLLNSVLMTYDLTKGPFNLSGYDTGILAYHGASLVGSELVSSSADADGTLKTLTLLFGLATLVDQIQVVITSSATNPPLMAIGGVLLRSVETFGIGSHTC